MNEIRKTIYLLEKKFGVIRFILVSFIFCGSIHYTLMYMNGSERGMIIFDTKKTR